MEAGCTVPASLAEATQYVVLLWFRQPYSSQAALARSSGKIIRVAKAGPGLTEADSDTGRCIIRHGASLGQPERVKDASWVAVLARALEEAFQAHEGALLCLAARLLEVLPPLDLHKVVREDLQGNQRLCGSACSSSSQNVHETSGVTRHSSRSCEYDCSTTCTQDLSYVPTKASQKAHDFPDALQQMRGVI